MRGYPQSIVSGDNAYQFRAEYRYHLPYGLETRPPSGLPLVGSFRLTPVGSYGRPDWDLVLRAFFDWGRTEIEDAIATEQDETLSSVGLGAELFIRNNISLRLDWGIALDSVRNDEVESGDSETHFAATIRY